jgi:hypothetical protein
LRFFDWIIEDLGQVLVGGFLLRRDGGSENPVKKIKNINDAIPVAWW